MANEWVIPEIAANHDESKIVDYVANVKGAGGKIVRVQAKLAPLSVVVLPLVRGTGM